jgi:hypothetical protein
MSEIAKILVWNMNGFSTRCDDDVKTRRVKLLEDMFDEHKPSLFALQETFDDLATRLSSSIRSQYNIEIGARGLASGYLKTDWNKNGRSYDHETVRTTMLPLQHTRIADIYVRFGTFICIAMMRALMSKRGVSSCSARHLRDSAQKSE